MKKLLYAVAAFAVLFTSCAKDDAVAPVEDKEALVSFCVNSPAVATRAEYGNGQTATTLQWAVYEVKADGTVNHIEELDDSKPIAISTTVDLKLIQGRSYDVLFWAASEDAPYEFDSESRTMTVDYQNLTANQESYDAFFKYENLSTINGAMSRTIELTRPFAQLNIATGDTDDAANAELTVAKTQVKVTNIYTKLDFATGFVSEPQEATFTLNTKADGNISVGDKSYNHIAMNYILVGKENENGQDKKLVNVELTINDEGLTRNYSSVPVQRNYRTNIVGNILTSPAEFNVVILPGFEEETLPSEKDALDSFIAAVQQGGVSEITLTQDITLPAPLTITKKLTIDLAGHTISAAIAKTDGHVLINDGVLSIKGGTISSTADNGGSAIKNNGTLIVEGTEITGAPKAGSSWPSYAINNYGAMTLKNVKVTSNHGAIAVYGDTTIENCEVVLNGIGGSAHVFYVGGEGTDLVINGGSYTHNGNTDGSLGYLMTGTTTTINGGTFNAYNGGYGFATYTGALTINGGTFNSMPIDWGGPITIKGGIYSKEPAKKYIATGYKAMKKDDKWHVVPADVDAVASTPAELATALSSGNSTIALAAGSYEIPDVAQGKTLTIKGTGNPKDVTVVAQNDGASEGNCDYCFRGSNVTFDGVTITTTGTYFPGYANMKGTFNNCIINGVYTTYDDTTFNNCTFNVSGDLYNLWTWGANVVNLNDCTINCDGKAVLLYGAANTKLTVNNCTFNDNGDDTVTDKAAIEIGNDYKKSYELTVNNAKVNGFAINPKGYNTGTTLWANKSSMSPENLKVTVDGKDAYKVVETEAIVDKAGVTYSGETFENPIADALYFNKYVLEGDATIYVERTYGAVILENVKGNLNGDAIVVDNDNNSVMVLQNCDFTLADGKKLIKSTNTIYQVFMSNITINGVKQTQDSIAQYLENVGWYQVVEEI